MNNTKEVEEFFETYIDYIKQLFPQLGDHYASQTEKDESALRVSKEAVLAALREGGLRFKIRELRAFINSPGCKAYVSNVSFGGQDPLVYQLHRPEELLP